MGDRERSKAYIKRACMLPLYLIEDVSELLENYSKTKKQLNQMLLFVHWKRNVKREGKKLSWNNRRKMNINALNQLYTWVQF